MNYRIYYKCSNCFNSIQVEVEKGTLAKNVLVCPHCGVSTLTKTEHKNVGTVYQYLNGDLILLESRP